MTNNYICKCLPSTIDSEWVNSLAPGVFDYSLKLVNCKFISFNDKYLQVFSDIAIRWMPKHLTHHHSTLVQVMVWCHQAPSHYLSQCWPRSISPNGVTRHHWVNKWVNIINTVIQSARQLIMTKLRCKWPFASNLCGKSNLFRFWLWTYQKLVTIAHWRWVQIWVMLL